VERIAEGESKDCSTKKRETMKRIRIEIRKY
jgi:hypothetical protein